MRSCELLNRLQARLAGLYGEETSKRNLDRLMMTVTRYQEDAAPRPALEESWTQGDALLITYGDMLHASGEEPLVTLKRFLDERLKGAISGVHLLPIFPYSSDEGFSVINYREVNPDLGDWEAVEAIGRDYRLILDMVLNHVSRKSDWFKDFVNGISPAQDYFITVEPGTDLGTVVRPRTSPLLARTQTRHGERWVWTTFSEDQIDLNFTNPDVLFEFLDILLAYVAHGARIIRLDAVAFLWKTIGTSCLHLPQTHQVVKLLRDVLELVAPEVLLLTETNVPHPDNIGYFGAGDEAHLVYQFSLPPLLLHALSFGSARYLTEWAASLQPPPTGCTFLNFTASHDGVGLRPLEGIIPENELAALIAGIKARGGLVSMRSDTDGKEQVYELNTTYFDALSEPQQPAAEQQVARFLCSQTIPLALRGIPAVYFHSLIAARNDHQAVDRTHQSRAINRRRWNEPELTALLSDPQTPASRVFNETIRRLKLRAQRTAFHPDGDQAIMDLEDGLFGIVRTAPDGSDWVLAISNLTADPKKLSISGYTHPEGPAGPLGDLLTGRKGAGKGKHEFALAPYQTLWLATSNPPP